MEFTIRKMYKEDWEQVYAIYRQGMETDLATFTIEEISYEDFDAQRLKEGRFVILEKNKSHIMGWVTLKKVSAIPEYYGVAEVSIYLDEKYQGNGVGTTLLNYLIDYSERAGYWTLEADIFANNMASRRLHEKCGFRLVGGREKLGQDRHGVWRDSVLMERRSKVVGVENNDPTL